MMIASGTPKFVRDCLRGLARQDWKAYLNLRSIGFGVRTKKIQTKCHVSTIVEGASQEEVLPVSSAPPTTTSTALPTTTTSVPPLTTAAALLPDETTSDGFVTANMGLIIAAIIGIALVCLLMVCGAMYFKRKSTKKGKAEDGGDSKMTSTSTSVSASNSSASNVKKEKKKKKKESPAGKEKSDLSGSLSSEFDVFVDDLSALARILNGLSLDCQLRSRSVDAVEVATEMAGSGVPIGLLNEVIGWKGTEWDQLDKDLGAMTTQIAAFGTGATWDDTKIQGGLAELERLAEDVKPFAEKLDAAKIDEFLKGVTELSTLNLTVLDGNPAADLLKNLNDIESITAHPAHLFEDTVINSKRVLSALKILEQHRPTLDGIEIKIESNIDNIGPFVSIVDNLNKSSASFSVLAGLAQELTSFADQSKKMRDLLSALPNSRKPFETLRNLTSSANRPHIQHTFGLINGFSDLEAISSDLQNERNLKLMSGGEDMGVLKENLKWIDELKVDFRKAVKSTSLIPQVKTPIQSIGKIIEKLSEFERSVNSTKQATSSLIDFSQKLQIITPEISNGRFQDFKKNIDELRQTFGGGLYVFRNLAGTKDLKVLEKVSTFEKALDTTKNTWPAIKKEIAATSDYQKIKEVLKQASFRFTVQGIFAKVLDLSRKMPTAATSNMTEWAMGVRTFQAPQNLTSALATTRNTATEVQRIRKSSDLVNAMKTVVETMKASTAALTNLRLKATELLAVSEPVATWERVTDISKTIGSSARCASALSKFSARTDEMEKAGLKLDTKLKSPTRKTEADEIAKAWGGYASLEWEVKSGREVVDNAMKEAVKVGKAETVRDLVGAIGKMEPVVFSCPKLTQQAAQMSSFDTSSVTEFSGEVMAVRSTLRTVSSLILDFATFSPNITSAPSAIEATAMFFESLFGASFSQTTPGMWQTFTESNWYIPSIILTIFVLGLSALAIWCLCKKRTSGADDVENKTNLQTDGKEKKKKKKKVSGDRSNETKRKKDEAKKDRSKEKQSGSKSKEIPEEATTKEEVKIEDETANKDPKVETEVENKDPKVETEAEKKDAKVVKETENKTPKVQKETKKKDPKVQKETENKDPKVQKETENKDAKVVKVTENKDAKVEKETEKKDAKVVKTKKEDQKKLSKEEVEKKLRKTDDKYPTGIVKLYPHNFKQNFGVFKDPNYDNPPKMIVTMITGIKTAVAVSIERTKSFLRSLKLKSEQQITEEANEITHLALAQQYKFQKMNALSDFFGQFDNACGYDVPVYEPDSVIVMKTPESEICGPVGTDLQDGDREPGVADECRRRVKRFWGAVGTVREHAEYRVELVSETLIEAIYSAKLRLWHRDSPTKKMTVFMNTLTADWVNEWPSVEVMARFCRRVNTVEVATLGVVMYMADTYRQLQVLVTIRQAYHNWNSLEEATPKGAAKQVLKKMYGSFLVAFDYYYVYLTDVQLGREDKDGAQKAKSSGHLIMEIKLAESGYVFTPEDETMSTTVNKEGENGDDVPVE
ncbi:unnamed protein product [Caenorhabditis sp. 36 PRJEB53466]|nr:unnamed protein product [Caenorhabditis sp. 36 PRJEB53466]